MGTVSHVLNDSKSVSARARQAVREAVAELGYRPNSLARSLIAHRPRAERTSRPDRPRLISVGYISIDYMVRIDAVPRFGDRTTSRSIEKMLGGPAANVAVFAAALGEPLEIGAEMVTHLGTDADSLWALEELTARNVDASGALQQPNDRLSRCIVLVEGSGRRTIINEPFQVPLDFLAQHLARRSPNAAPACVHFDGFHFQAAREMREDLRAAGYLMSLHSAGFDVAQGNLPDRRDLLETFDLLFLDQGSFERLTEDIPDIGRTPERFFDLVPRNVCRAILLTRGAEGAVLLRPGEKPVHCAAPSVEVVDATGAGDAFTGIFLASWLSQGDLAMALSHAVRGASLSLSALGAQGRLPTTDEVSAQATAGGA